MAETIFEVLKNEHEEIQGLLEQAMQQPDKFSEFSTMLAKHVQAEEVVLYAALKREPETREIVLEGFEEHRAVD